MPGTQELAATDVGSLWPSDTTYHQAEHEFDYIIIGGGTAGCVLASRLSEDPAVSVLLVERGPVADTWASRVPLISGNPYRTDTLAKTWWSLPVRHADNRYLEIMRGEALGGTSRINSLLYTRGFPGDYNRWKELGNDGWCYDDVEPYFVMSEKTAGHPASPHWGVDGPWQNRQFPGVPYNVIPHVHSAFEKAGIERYPDLNSPSMPAVGTGLLDVIQDGSYTRHSLNAAFLPRSLVEERKARLKICTNTLVTKIHLETRGSVVQATGVYFEAAQSRKAGLRYFARARKEVLLCAGALGSPQLLLLSGIGPKDHLVDKGVPVVRDMPAVGSYLQDHVGVPFTYEVPVNDSLHHLEVSPPKAMKELIKYLIRGDSLFSFPFQASSTFVASRLLDDTGTLTAQSSADLDTSAPENRPDIEIMHLTNNATDHDIPNKGIFTFLLAHIRPKSYGSVRLATANPRAHPDVDLGFLSNPEDHIPLRKGARLVLRVAKEMKKQGYPLEDLIVPRGESDAEVESFVRANLRTCFHYTSTCRMGQEIYGERQSVVDAHFCVHGVEGLRVCDASVFPEIVGAHTMAPTVMVAERCADFVKRMLLH